MGALVANVFSDTYQGARQSLFDLFARNVTYRQTGSAVTAVVPALFEHLADLSPATAVPHQRRKFTFRAEDLPTDSPRRGDKFEDTLSQTWTVFDLLMVEAEPEAGMITCFARILQTRG